MKKVLMALAMVPVLAQAQDVARPIALDEAVRLARRNAPAAVQSRNSVRSTSMVVRQRIAAFLPTLDFSAGASRTDGTRLNADGTSLISTDAPWRGSHRLNSGLEVFDGGRRYFELMAARANVDAAEATETTQLFTVALNVKQQYFAVLAARESRVAAGRQLEQAEQGLHAATAKVAAGASTRSDSLRSVIQVGNAQLAILTADNNLGIANATLSRLIGSESIVTAELSDTTQAASINSSDAELYQFIEEGPAVRQANAQLIAAKQSSRSTKTPYLPTLSLSLGYAFTAQDSGFRFIGNSANKNISTGVSIRFPLFNGLSREVQAFNASIAVDNAEAQLRDARLNARQQLVQQLGTLRTAEARVQIQRASVESAEEDLRVQQQRYNLGAGTLLDLITSQTTLNSAQQALIQARLDARTAKAQIEALVGRDL